jgi:hypothetical protein
MREQLKIEDNNFIDVLERINTLYLRDRDINSVYAEIKESNLPQRASGLLKSLFSVSHSNNLTFSKEFIKSMTLDNARKFLISEQKKKKEQSMNSRKYGQQQSQIDVNRNSNSHDIYIKGSSLKFIENFLRYELFASWSEELKVWVISDSKNEQDINEIYESIVNKITYNELREIKKEEYYDNPNEQTLIIYGRSSVLYTGVVNRSYLDKHIDELEDLQEKGDKNFDGNLYEALVATFNAYNELKELGFLIEKEEEVKSEKGEVTLPIARFLSPEAKKILAQNIKATKRELTVKLSSLLENEVLQERG